MTVPDDLPSVLPIKRRAAKVPFDPQVFLTEAAFGRTVAQYRNNQIIFSQGDTADAVFYVIKGRIKLSVTSEHGKEAVVALLGENEFCGAGCLANQPARLVTAQAISECKLMRIERSALLMVIHDQPLFADMFVGQLLERTIRVEADLVDQLFNSSEKRLARTLLILANYGKAGPPEPVLAKISQETLAEMIGTTRSRVSHFMNKFRRLGLIDYNGHIEVHSSLLTIVLNDGPQLRSDDEDNSPLS